MKWNLFLSCSYEFVAVIALSVLFVFCKLLLFVAIILFYLFPYYLVVNKFYWIHFFLQEKSPSNDVVSFICSNQKLSRTKLEPCLKKIKKETEENPSSLIWSSCYDLCFNPKKAARNKLISHKCNNPSVYGLPKIERRRIVEVD